MFGGRQLKTPVKMNVDCCLQEFHCKLMQNLLLFMCQSIPGCMEGQLQLE